MCYDYEEYLESLEEEREMYIQEVTDEYELMGMDMQVGDLDEYPTDAELEDMARDDAERFQQELDALIDAQIEESVYGE